MKNIVTFTQEEYYDILTKLGLAQDIVKYMRKSITKDRLDLLLSEVTRLLTDQTDHELEDIRSTICAVERRTPFSP